MPRVEQYGGPRVDTAVVRGPQAQALPASAFKLNAVADTVESVGKTFATVAERVAVTEAEQTALAFERDKNKMFFDPDSGYFNTKGKTAYDGAQGAAQALDQLKEKYAGQLSTPAAQRAFNQVAARHVASAQNDIMRHASTGLKTWETATVAAQAENSIENAALYHNDNDKLAVQMELGIRAVRDAAEMGGVGAEAAEQNIKTFKSSFASTAITAAAQTSAAAGTQLLEKYRDNLTGPAIVKVEKMLETKTKEEKVKADSDFAVIRAGSILDDYEDDLAGAFAEVEKEEDLDRRKALMSQVSAQFNRQKAAKSEARYGAWQDFQETQRTGSATLEEWKATNKEAWTALSEEQKRKAESGELIKTDKELYHSLLRMPADEFMKEDVTDQYSTQIAPADMTRLLERRKSISEGKENTQLRATSTIMSSVVEGIFGAKKTRNKKTTESVNEFYDLMQGAIEDAESAKGAKLTPTEVQALTGKLGADIVVEYKHWFDTEVTAKNTPVADVVAMNTALLRVGNTPETRQQIVAIREFLVDNKRPITVQTIAAAWNQATGAN